MLTRRYYALQLAGLYTLPELRELLRDFDRESYAAIQLDDTDAGYWEQICGLLREAITCRRHRDAYYAARLPQQTRRLDPEELKERVDLTELIGRDVKLRRAGHNYTGLCPFHREHTPSFVVFADHNRWVCFGCERKGDAFSYVMESMALDFKGAYNYLAQLAGVPTELTPPRAPRRILDL